MRQLIKDLVTSTFATALGDLPTTVYLTSSSVGEYDPVTGTQSSQTVHHAARGVCTNLSQRDVENLELLLTGRKLLIPCSELAGVYLETLNDSVTVDGVEYNVRSVKQDPAGALYTFIIQSKEGTTLHGST